MQVKVGDIVLVFDSKLWNGKDVGDNAQFWRSARILALNKLGKNEVADVQFLHDNRISKMHFTKYMEPTNDRHDG